MLSRVTATALRAQRKSMMSLSRHQISSQSYVASLKAYVDLLESHFSSNLHIIQARDVLLKKDMKTDSNKMCLYLKRRLTYVGALPRCSAMTHGQTTLRK